MAQQTPVYSDPVLKKHAPMNPGDVVLPTFIPVSAHPQNNVKLLGDGLYVGVIPSQSTYYVHSSSGVDTPGGGTGSVPFLTLDYCLQQIIAQSVNGMLTQNVTILLSCGANYPLSGRYYIAGNLTLAWYGDPVFGNYPGSSPVVGAI